MMVERLDKLKCVACRADAPRVPDEEIPALLRQIPDWRVIQPESARRLQRVFRFKDFADALAFTDRVGELAQNEGHHPALLTEWGRVTVTWWSRKIKGLHRNDFIAAAKTDNIYRTLHGEGQAAERNQAD